LCRYRILFQDYDMPLSFHKSIDSKVFYMGYLLFDHTHILWKMIDSSETIVELRDTDTFAWVGYLQLEPSLSWWYQLQREEWWWWEWEPLVDMLISLSLLCLYSHWYRWHCLRNCNGKQFFKLGYSYSYDILLSDKRSLSLLTSSSVSS